MRELLELSYLTPGRREQGRDSQADRRPQEDHSVGKSIGGPGSCLRRFEEDSHRHR